MPELPEVETLKNCLANKLIGLRFVALKQNRDELRAPLSPTLKQEILQATIICCRRRAKFLILDLSNQNSLVIHLGMSWRFTMQPQHYYDATHDHVLFDSTLQILRREG